MFKPASQNTPTLNKTTNFQFRDITEIRGDVAFQKTKMYAEPFCMWKMHTKENSALSVCSQSPGCYPGGSLLAHGLHVNLCLYTQFCCYIHIVKVYSHIRNGQFKFVHFFYRHDFSGAISIHALYNCQVLLMQSVMTSGSCVWN